ncbi:MAG TPA: Hsp20/alpha crystallin family protein [Oceanobacillus sp.]|nr:Hsp20/alpha crystallin family protein [Oceanobacillus sp.]
MSTIIRWNPIREMAAMQSAMDRFFDETWRSFRDVDTSLALPLDVHETGTAYHVVAALPGIPADSIHVSIHDGALTISGEVPQPSYPEDARALLLERTYGRFSRTIRLPEPVVPDQIEATLDNGVLTLNVPKSPEAQPKQIPVRVHSNGHSGN